MGGLGPGIGGLEYLLIAAVALIVVGPERLPGLLRQLGKMVGKARRMADEFRNSFDEMARQSELDDLRKEVEALRTNQGMVKLGDEANAAFRDIKTELDRPVDTPSLPEPAVMPVDEWPDSPPVMMPVAAPPETVVQVKPKAARKKPAASTAPKPAAPKSTSSKATAKPAKPRAPRKPKLDL